MPILLLLIFPIVELYVLFDVGARIGLANTVFGLLASFVLGLGLAKAQGRYILAKLQEAMAQGRLPDDRVLHGLLIFIAGVLFALPGFLSDIVALCLVLPGTRHIVLALVKRRLARQFKAGNFKVFSFGGGGFGTTRPTRSTRPSDGERDVTPQVIDVAPVSAQTTPHKTTTH